jgi:uncharacterized protein (TIGR02099 family)
MTSWLARFLAGTLVGALVLVALAVGGLRLAMVYIEYFEPEIEALLEREVLPGVAFTRLDGAMNGFNPVLRVDGVSITLADRSQPLFIERLETEFDFFASLAQRAPVVREISGDIETLELVKDEADRWWISDLALLFAPGRGTFPDLKQALEWVPSYLNLNLKQLVVVDRRTADRHLLSDVSAQISHRQGQHFVRFGAGLPERLGHSLLVKSVIGPEQSLIYVNTSRLQLTPIAELVDLDTWGLRRAALDGELWINLSGYDLVAVNGNLTLEDGVVQMAADKSPLQVSYHSRFSAVDRGAGWRVNSHFDRLRVNDRGVAGFRAQLELGERRAGRQLSAWVDRVPLESLPVVAGQWLPAEINRQIAGGRLDGELRDVFLHIDLDRPEQFQLGARAREVSSGAFAEYPGASGIDAELLIGNDRFGVTLRSDNVTLDFGEHFDAPWELRRLEVDAVGQRDEQGMRLALNKIRLQNADVEALGRAWMEFDQDQRPLTFIRASFENARASSVSKYLPRKYLPPNVQQWLDRGIKSGLVPAGELQYHGRLRDMRELERKQAVEFYVDFSVEDAEILFSPDWLPARGGRGHVQFHNVGVQFDLDSAAYDRIEQARVRGGIDDFRKPVLNLHIETDSSTGDALQSWIATPVGRHFHQAVSNFAGFGGKIATVIDIALPLAGDRLSPQTMVSVDFDDASAIADDWGLQLSKINGRLLASGEVLRAQQIEALFFDDPIEVDIAGSETDGHTRIAVRGLIESANLMRKLPDALAGQISGKSDWRVDLDFSPRSRQAGVPLLRLQASSGLQGSVIGLPRPLDKSAARELPLSASVEFHDHQLRFDARAGDRWQTRGSLASSGGGYRLDELDIALASNLVAKQRPGVHIYGYIDETSLDEWLAIVDPDSIKDEVMLQTAWLQVSRLHAFDREIDDLQFELRRRQERFVGSLESSAVSGSFDLPRQPSPADPALIELDYLRIDEPRTTSSQSPLKPGQLVDFRLSSKSLLYHDMQFEDLLVQARAQQDRLYVDRLGLRRDRLVLSGTGQWDYDAQSDSHLSSVALALKGPGLGEAVAGIGFGDTMSGGTLDFRGGFSWPAAITSFDIERLDGDASLRIDDGVLNNVEPGSGRFVGLLSLSALPRRLSLDFSDLLIKGMEFSEISGNYHIEDGILFTRDTRMDGPAAKIRISGKTNISNRSYDQNIKVTPKIRQTLPVIGAVSAGATVGWGLLLLQNLFKKVIDEAVEIEYRVTGSWDDPQIELIKAVDEHHRNLPKRDEIPEN